MAKKSLKKRIDDLVDALGGAKKPTLVDIRNELVAMGALAESLENEQALAEKDARIAEMEAELGSVQVALQTANTEIEAFRAARKKQEEEERQKEMPEIQFKILKGLPTEHMGSGATLKGICQRTGIPPDEAEIHLARLEGAGFAKRRYFDMDAITHITSWYRTIRGNELILAKRLAGEEEDDDIPYKYDSLPKIQHDALLLMVGEDEGINEREIAQRLGKSLALTRYNLALLRDADMATDGDEPDYCTGRTWVLLKKGEEYLAERNLL